MEQFKPRGRHTISLKLLDPQPDDRILDVGCAHGYFEREYLIGRVALVRGVDAAADAIAQAKRDVGEEYFQVADSAALPFGDAEFNKVLFSDTLEHVDDELGSLREIHRVLEPGGRLVLSTPNSFLNRLDNIPYHFPRYARLRRLPSGPFHRHYDIEQLQRMLGDRFVIERYLSRALFLTYVRQWMLWFGRTQELRERIRKVSGLVEDIDYAIRLPRGWGFTLFAVARRV